MKLSGQQYKQLQDALIAAFPTKFQLEQMLLFELEKKLDSIANGTNLQEIVFHLIKTALAEGWVEDLLNAALKSNPQNPQLQTIAQELLTKLQHSIDSNLDIDALVQKARSFQVSLAKLEQVKEGLNNISSVIQAKHEHERHNKNLSLEQKKKYLAKDTKLKRRLIEEFFAGQEVRCDIFQKICSQLELEWRDILDINALKLQALVDKVRWYRRDKIKDQCGTMRMLDSSQPLADVIRRIKHISECLR
jgi:DNA-binding Xre family transcriptional regulator